MKAIAGCATLALLLVCGRAGAQSAPAPLPHETFFYPHDGLQLEAHLYRPSGSGPFPLVVYNHGSAPPAEEPVEWPAPFIARLFVPSDHAQLSCVVVVSSRRCHRTLER